MSEPAEGTISFLLCDIEGSTRLVQAAGAAYAEILADKRRILRSALAEHEGNEIDAHGDELFAAFVDANAAAAAAVSAQRTLVEHRWPGGHDVRIRMGLHTGAVIVTEDGYTGIDVHRAARIGSAGHGGQILVSEATRALLHDAATRDLGTHRLAGLPDPEHIHQLYADGLPRDFPPLRNTVAMLGNAMRVVIAEDSVLLREGVVRLLEESGFEVAAQSDNPDDLLRHVAMHKPQVAIVDIRMPPTHTDEGLVAARQIRERFPGTGVLVLSQYVEAGYALDLLAEGSEGVGYLLKDRVSDLEEFAGAVRRVGEGGSALDPAVVSQLVGRRRQHGPLDELTPREREVMELMAEGRSNQAIAERMFVTLRAVEKHVTSIFTKLDLPASTDDHRRVLAVLAFLRDP
jgi:DNA-binding NarL/FixJ family response regulator/class 3 adenylate cyclase